MAYTQARHNVHKTKAINSGPYYFDVIKKGTYSITVKYCENILELSNNFIIIEDVNNSPYNIHIDYNQQVYNEDAVRGVLAEWADHIAEKSACTTWMNSDIREVLATVDFFTIRSCAPRGYTVQGDRIYNNQKLENQKTDRQKNIWEGERKRAEAREAMPYYRPKNHVTYDDVGFINTAIENAIAKKHGLNLCFYIEDKKNAEAAKRLISWPDVNRELRLIVPKKQQKLDYPWIKSLWTDPSLSINPERNYHG